MWGQTMYSNVYGVIDSAVDHSKPESTIVNPFVEGDQSDRGCMC